MTDAYEPVPVEWQYKYQALLTGGANIEDRGDTLLGEELKRAHNVRYDEQTLMLDTGYQPFNDETRGVPRATWEYRKKNGVVEYMCITNLTVYKYAGGEYQYISNSIETTVNAVELAGQTIITVVASAGFVIGSHVGILLDNGLQHKTTVVSLPTGTSIEIADALPSDTSAGKAFVSAVILAGSDDEKVSIADVSSHDWVIFTNGVDSPFRYDGTDIVTMNGFSGLPTNFIAKKVLVHYHHVMFLNCIENGTDMPQRLRWSDTGDPTEFDGTASNAGFLDLYDNAQHIMDAAKLGANVIVYRYNSIVRVEFVGSSELYYRDKQTVGNQGALGINCAVDMGEYHIVFGRTDIYAYDGSSSVQPISRRIRDEVLGVYGNLDPQYKARSFGVRIRETDEVVFIYPTLNNSIPNRWVRFFYTQENGVSAWTTRDLSHPALGVGVYRTESYKRIIDLEGAVQDQAWRINSQAVNQYVDTLQICGYNPAQVYDYDYTTVGDAGTYLAYDVTTADFNLPQMPLRSNRVDFLLRGNNVQVEVSLDRGKTWEVLDTISPGLKFKIVRVFHQRVGNFFRYRLTGSGGGFALQAIGFEFREETEDQIDG